MRKISEQEIELLFEFTRKHYVEYYDVQVELVDHLANGIEEQWQEHTKLSFEEAMQREFKKFGIFGFTDLVALKQSELKKYYYKMIWREFKTFFKLPKIILTGGLFYFFYIMYSFLAAYTTVNELGYTVFVACIVLAYVIDYFFYRKQLRKLSNDKKWLISDVALSVTGGPLLIFYYLNYLVGFRIDYTQLSLWNLTVMCLLSAVYCVFFIIMKTKIQKMLCDEVIMMQKRFV